MTTNSDHKCAEISAIKVTLLYSAWYTFQYLINSLFGKQPLAYFKETIDMQPYFISRENVERFIQSNVGVTPIPRTINHILLNSQLIDIPNEICPMINNEWTLEYLIKQDKQLNNTSSSYYKDVAALVKKHFERFWKNPTAQGILLRTLLQEKHTFNYAAYLFAMTTDVLSHRADGHLIHLLASFYVRDILVENRARFPNDQIQDPLNRVNFSKYNKKKGLQCIKSHSKTKRTFLIIFKRYQEIYTKKYPESTHRFKEIMNNLQTP